MDNASINSSFYYNKPQEKSPKNNLNQSNSNIDLINSNQNNLVEECISKMFFYFTLMTDIAKENAPLSKQEEIELLSLKFKKTAEKIHKENNQQLYNSFCIVGNVNNSTIIKPQTSLINNQILHNNIVKSSQNSQIQFNNNSQQQYNSPIVNKFTSTSKDNSLKQQKLAKPNILNHSLFSNKTQDNDLVTIKKFNLFEMSHNNSFDSSSILDLANSANSIRKINSILNQDTKNYLKLKKNIIFNDMKKNEKFELKVLNAICFGNYLVVSFENGQIKVIEKPSIFTLPKEKSKATLSQKSEYRETLTEHKYPVYALLNLSLLNEKEIFISGEWSKEGILILWENKNGNFKMLKKRVFNDGISCFHSYEKGLVIIGFCSGKVNIYNVIEDKIIYKIQSHNKEIRSICSNKSYLISAGRDKKILLWDIGKKAISIFQFRQEHKSWINCLSTMGEDYILSGGGDTTDPYVKIWKFNINKSLKTILLHSDIIVYMSITNFTLTSCSTDGSIKRLKFFDKEMNGKDFYTVIDEFIIPSNIDKLLIIDESPIIEKDEDESFDWKNESLDDDVNLPSKKPKILVNLNENDNGKKQFIVINWKSENLAVY